METRPYGKVIANFLERTFEMSKDDRRNYATLANHAGEPNYSILAKRTGLRLDLTVPTRSQNTGKLEDASLVLFDVAGSNPSPLVGVSFDWRSRLTHRFSEINPDFGSGELGTQVSGLNGDVVDEPYQVRNAYHAMRNMFGIIAEKRKNVIDKQLNIRKHEPLGRNGVFTCIVFAYAA